MSLFTHTTVQLPETIVRDSGGRKRYTRGTACLLRFGSSRHSTVWLRITSARTPAFFYLTPDLLATRGQADPGTGVVELA